MRSIRNIKNCSHNIWNMSKEVKYNNKRRNFSNNGMNSWNVLINSNSYFNSKTGEQGGYNELKNSKH